jgi:hypothetical protein
MNLLTVERRFSVWEYTVSHSTLLLRSVDADRYQTRIDVMFKPVAALKLPTAMASLTVRDAYADEAQSLRSEVESLASATARLTGANHAEYRLFVLDCGGEPGWILASLMVAYEDAEDYSAPSAILRGAPPGALVVKAT